MPAAMSTNSTSSCAALSRGGSHTLPWCHEDVVDERENGGQESKMGKQSAAPQQAREKGKKAIPYSNFQAKGVNSSESEVRSLHHDTTISSSLASPTSPTTSEINTAQARGQQQLQEQRHQRRRYAEQMAQGALMRNGRTLKSRATTVLVKRTVVVHASCWTRGCSELLGEVLGREGEGTGG